MIESTSHHSNLIVEMGSHNAHHFEQGLAPTLHHAGIPLTAEISNLHFQEDLDTEKVQAVNIETTSSSSGAANVTQLFYIS